MSIFDKYENFVYLNNGTLSKEEEEEEEKKRQEQLCELMYMYQQYQGIIKEQQYALRGSKLWCQYGTRRVLLDCLEDYGICKSGLPLLTTLDCKAENIHNFGSCLCPEKNYRGRLPMTAAADTYGRIAKKASCNVFPHICVPLIDEEHGWKQIDQNLLVEVNAQGYAPMLLDNAVLVCQYGGIVTIEEVLEVGKEPKTEELPWIPSNILQLTGNTKSEKNLKKWIDILNGNISDKTLKWGQDKIEYIWKRCREFYEDYRVQVDPRLLLAIIAKEGTGSFNTSSDNLAGDGGNGVENDFEADSKNAVDLLGGKIIAYVQFHEAFSKARADSYSKGYVGIKDYDDILHYINWETPRLWLNSKMFKSGVYADDNNWNSGVRQIYSELAYDGVTEKYTKYVKGLRADIFMETAKTEGIKITTEIEFEACKNGKDKMRVPNNEYTITGIVPNFF